MQGQGHGRWSRGQAVLQRVFEGVLGTILALLELRLGWVLLYIACVRL